ncbi:hypothetical protein [Parendozoicomonas sp. Alg238-R29]|uniref:hypothetical protein n=1 Tax=Parendozoicomonas sp. Alg238-R29 TaxID=2993446 RepID=UPI00248E7EA9|nr:hypothetical protein [Parendozoicomonas sp. Alg238-R29]
MSTFIIVPVGGATNIDQILPQKFGNKALRLPNGEWLVAYDGTSRQLSDDIGISESPSGSAIVLNFSAYWGRAGKDVWEWIAANGGA